LVLRLLVGPPGLEPGTKGLCLPLQFSLPVICNPLAINPGTFDAVVGIETW